MGLTGVLTLTMVMDGLMMRGLMAECDADAVIAARRKAANAKLQGKRDAVQRMVHEALDHLAIQGKTGEVEITLSRYGVKYITLSRYGVKYVGGRHANHLGATTDHWYQVLSEGLGTKFYIDWDHAKYSGDDLWVLRLGEPIFEVMMSRGLHPEWDGTPEGNFTITAVDTAGAKLALAMALHSRLGAGSPLSLVASSLALMCPGPEETVQVYQVIPSCLSLKLFVISGPP